MEGYNLMKYFNREDTPSFYIISDIIKYSILKEWQHPYNLPVKEELETAYQMGYISLDWENVEKFRSNDIYQIEIEDNYLVVRFVLMSMIIGEELVEDFLCEKWYQTRMGFYWFSSWSYLQFIKEKKLGVKVKAFAGIGGPNHSSVLYTPEEVQKLL